MTAREAPFDIQLASRIFWRRSRLAICVFAVVLTIAASLAVSLPSLYSAAATTLVEGQKVPERFITPGQTNELERRLQGMGQALLSRSKVLEIIAKFGLYEELKDWLSPQRMVVLFRSNLSIALADSLGRPSPGAAFTVTFRADDPNKAAQVANEIASMFVEEDLKAREKVAAGTSEFMRGRLDEFRTKLEEQEAEIRKFQEANIEDLPGQEPGQGSELDRLRAQLLANEEKRRQAAQRIEEAKAELDRLRDPMPSSVDVKVKIAQLEERYKRVREANRQLKGAEADARELETEGEALKIAVADNEERRKGVPRRAEQIQALKRDYATTQDLYQSLLKRYEDAKLVETLEQVQKGEQFRLVEPAVPADRPSAPNRPRLLVLALAFALAAAAGAAVLAETLDTSFHAHDDLRGFSKIPVLVSVPRIVTAAAKRRQRMRLALTSLSLVAGLPTLAFTVYLFVHNNQWLVGVLS